MKNIFKKAVVLATVLSSWQMVSTVQADELYLGVPGYGGNGCPSGSASVTLSPDQKSLSVLFDQYMAEAGGFNGKQVDRSDLLLVILNQGSHSLQWINLLHSNLFFDAKI